MSRPASRRRAPARRAPHPPPRGATWQVKALEDAELNYDYLRAALLAKASPKCEPAAPSRYASFDGARLISGRLHGGGRGWNASRAAAACDATPRCVGFSLLRTPKRWLFPEMVEVTLHSRPEVVGLGYLHLPPNASSTAYLRAGAAGDAGVACILHADAKTLNEFGEMLPRGDTFETDNWAPVVDGVALDQTISARIAAGNLAPGKPMRTHTHPYAHGTRPARAPQGTPAL